MTMATIPENCRDLFAKKAFAHVATVGRDGTPQVTPVWVDYDGAHVRFNTARGRVKDKNLQRNPKVALSMQDPDNPYRYLQIRGRAVEMTEKRADEHIDPLAKKHLGQDRYPHRRAGDGSLPQEAAGGPGGSVLGEALAGFDAVWQVEREMEVVAAQLAAVAGGDGSAALTARCGDLQPRFGALGGYRLETEAKTILGGLGFREADCPRPLTEFSGGWRMRAALARLLLQRPSLLLLDEPTNHLDIESLEWLEAFLADYEGTVVLVSHDRYFLNRMVTSIAELGPSGLAVYPGDYDEYLVQREARRELLEAQARNQAKRVAEIERFIERFRYQATKARQVQSRVKMLERMERVEVEREARVIRFAFPQPPRTGRRVAALAGVHKAYGDNVVYASVDFEVERGARIALVGANGARKSTLLRIVAGGLPFDRGARTPRAPLAVHYYAPHQLEALTPSPTVPEELERAGPELG